MILNLDRIILRTLVNLVSRAIWPKMEIFVLLHRRTINNKNPLELREHPIYLTFIEMSCVLSQVERKGYQANFGNERDVN